MNVGQHIRCPKGVIKLDKSTLGEWSENIKVWWSGVNGSEYIAHHGAREIAVYDYLDGFNDLPSRFIKGDRRIESAEDFDHVMLNGTEYICQYSLVEKQSEGKEFRKSLIPRQE